MGKGNSDFTQLKEWIDRIENFDKNRKQAFIEECLKELAARLIRYCIKRTPVVSGALRREWTVANSNFTIKRHGDTYQVVVTNPLFYASYVEYGHLQEPGRYVPDIGKRLKASWVKGKFMLTISESELQRIAPKLLQSKLDKELEGLFGQ